MDTQSVGLLVGLLSSFVLVAGLLVSAFWDLRQRGADPVPTVVMLLLFWPVGIVLWVRARRRQSLQHVTEGEGSRPERSRRDVRLFRAACCAVVVCGYLLVVVFNSVAFRYSFWNEPASTTSVMPLPWRPCCVSHR